MPGRLLWIIFSKGGHSHEPVSVPISGPHRDPSGNVPRLSSGKQLSAAETSETDSLAFSPASGALYFGRFSVLFLSNFNATRSFSSAAAAPVSLSQDASDLHLEVRQYFSGCLRGFCLPQQPFPGGKCHYNCQPQSDRKRTVVSDQIRPLLQRNLFKLRSVYLVSCLPCGKKYDRR